MLINKCKTFVLITKYIHIYKNIQNMLLKTLVLHWTEIIQ